MYEIYLNYRDNNEVLTSTSSLYRAKKLCNQLANECGDNFIVWYKKLKQ